jgi:hypothetical protein
MKLKNKTYLNDNSLIDELNKVSKILFIPIVSMRNYDTGLYDLACDGNINRILSTISLLNDNILINITLPKNSTNIDFLTNSIKLLNKKVKLIFVDGLYGINANATRKNTAWLDFIRKNVYNYDKIIFEPNIIGSILLDNSIKFIYWCPVSNTINSTISFVNEFDELDKKIASICTTYVCTKSQQQYLKGKSIVDNSMLINIGKFNIVEFNKPIIYLPFRLSDKGYKIEYICQILLELENNFDFMVAYSSPNNVPLPVELKNSYKVFSDRIFYNFMLNNKKVCIPFLENPDEILHMSLFEMINNNTFVIGHQNKMFDFDINLNNESELKTALIQFLTK